MLVAICVFELGGQREEDEFHLRFGVYAWASDVVRRQWHGRSVGQPLSEHTLWRPEGVSL